jgi:hypothetical protein
VARYSRKSITSTYVVAPSKLEEQRKQRYIRRQSVRFTLVVLFVLIVQRFLTTPNILAQAVCPTSQDSISVPLRAQATPLSMRLSTNINNVLSLNPSSMPTATANLAYLRQWNPPLIRLLFGFRGNTSLPESRPGQWDFSRPDAAIGNLRAQGASFFLSVHSAPPWMFDKTGHLPPDRVKLFAQYMARLVGWYNKGGFRDEKGVYHASGHTNWVHTWEIWNEPDSGDEIPVNTLKDRQAAFFTPLEYAQMYNTVVQAMRAVDSTIVVGGPSVIGYITSIYTNYISGFLRYVKQPVGFLSIHFYSTGNLKEPDQAVLQHLTDSYDSTVDAVQTLLHKMKRSIPLWVDELGFNASSHPPIDQRSTSIIGYAFIADAFIQSEVRNVTQLNQHVFVGNAQNGMMDQGTGQPYRTYWLYMMLSQSFPPGSQMLALTQLHSGIIALSAISPDHQSLHILLVNMRAATAKDVNGHGVSHTLCIDLVNKHAGVGVLFGAPATAWTFDANTPINQMPVSSLQWLVNAGQDHVLFQEHLSGYSATLLELPVR